MATSKTFFAITKFDFGGQGLERHMSPIIMEERDFIDASRKEKARAAGTLIENVTPVKGKMVTMPNGRKAKLFNVDGKIWARYSDGSANSDYKI